MLSLVIDEAMELVLKYDPVTIRNSFVDSQCALMKRVYHEDLIRLAKQANSTDYFAKID